MEIAFFDSHRFERDVFLSANQRYGHEITFFDVRLDASTASLARGFPVVCSFVNDRVDEKALETLKEVGVRLIALRSAGFNHVDLSAAKRLQLKVVRVPEYSPHAVAEHAVALALALNRKIHRAYLRVREGNFSLDGLVGFDMYRKTVGVVGTGRIGSVAARLFAGFGCEVLAFDVSPRPDLPARFVPLDELLEKSHIVSLHVPLTPATHHLIDARALGRMRPQSMLINTGRGALIETRSLIDALKSGHLGAAGLDVYEEEEGIFFQDLSERVLKDDVLARLLTFPNVIITAHQGFLTQEALVNIADTTLANVRAFERGERLVNEVRAEDVLR